MHKPLVVRVTTESGARYQNSYYTIDRALEMAIGYITTMPEARFVRVVSCQDKQCLYALVRAPGGFNVLRHANLRKLPKRQPVKQAQLRKLHKRTIG